MADGTNGKPRATFFESKSSVYDANSFIALAFLNILLSITAALGNILIVLALGKESLLHPPSRLLLRSLAFTDLCVGLIAQPITALHAISILTESYRIYRVTFASSYITSSILSGVSLFILTFISVDRLLALSLGVRYRQTVTTGRVRAFVGFSWVLTIANGFTNLLSNKLIFYIVCVTGILLCVVTSTFCYTKIYHILRLQQMKVQTTHSQGRPNESSVVISVERYRKTVSSARCCCTCYHHSSVRHINVQSIESQGQSSEPPNKSFPLNVKRYKKTVSSALWVHLTLLACYLPYSIVSGLKAITGNVFPVAEGFTATLIFFNSSLNPVLYCWRIREVREAAKETIKHYCGFL